MVESPESDGLQNGRDLVLGRFSVTFRPDINANSSDSTEGRSGPLQNLRLCPFSIDLQEIDPLEFSDFRNFIQRPRLCIDD